MSEFYFTFKDDGSIATRLIAGTNPIPAGAQLVSDEIWRRTAQETDGIWGIDGNGTIRKKPFPTATITAEMLCASIDVAADIARKSVAGDPLRAVEYERAAAEAKAFQDAGCPDDAVPRSVAAWAINGRTAEQAAADILAKATAFEEVLYDLRETRLQAKENLRLLMADGHVTNAQQLADQAISDIQALTAGVSELL